MLTISILKNDQIDRKILIFFLNIFLPLTITSFGFAHDFNLWVNDGLDKVTQDELRMSRGENVFNSVWDGKKVSIWGAKNEVVSFNIIIENPYRKIDSIRVSLLSLKSPEGIELKGTKREENVDVLDFTKRQIEIFMVRYLKIKGLSQLAYTPVYDERHVPENLQLPYKGKEARSDGTFNQRPGANKMYPDIAIPIEIAGNVEIEKGHNQSFWVDIYIPREKPAGLYTGNVIVEINNNDYMEIPVFLEVFPFVLPDKYNAKTMVWMNEPDVNERYTGIRWKDAGAVTPEIKAVMDEIWFKHHQMAKRHRVSLITQGIELFRVEKLSRWKYILNGELFSSKMGYAGPGELQPGDVYSIGTYGSWRNLKEWDKHSKTAMWENSDNVVEIFEENYPHVDYFLYLLDEPQKDRFGDVERWAAWVKENPGSGNRLKTLCTITVPEKQLHMPSVDISFESWGEKEIWQNAIRQEANTGGEIWAYNGWRPASGSFMTEDDGVALRVNGWIQFKHDIGRWFYWASTNYRNPSYEKHHIDVFGEAATFGKKSDEIHPKYGETGHNFGNGDGLLFYPGTDLFYPERSYGIKGPIASLRLKIWRRGLQDYEYLHLAKQKNSEAVEKLIKEMVPKSLWELGVSNKRDPTYVHAGVSWSINPDDWENARKQLAIIIMQKKSSRY